jgi:hypothetical protein
MLEKVDLKSTVVIIKSFNNNVAESRRIRNVLKRIQD